MRYFFKSDKRVDMVIVKILLFTICIFLTACNAVSDEGGNEMGEQSLTSEGFGKIFTKDEFLEYLKANSLGITEKDFIENNIDIEEFIRINFLSKEKIKMVQLDLKELINNKVMYMRIEEVRSYAATEIIIAESTDEEYRKFIEEYLKTIEEEVEIIYNNQRTYFERDYGFDRYRIKDDFDTEFYIVRTTDIEMLKEMRWRFSENPCHAQIPHNDASSGSLLYFSKNNKYFMGFVNSVRSVDIVKNFCEMDD